MGGHARIERHPPRAPAATRRRGWRTPCTARSGPSSGSPGWPSWSARFELSDDPFAVDVLDRLGATTYDVYLAALDGIEPGLAERIVRVADAVLDSSLRAWSSGKLPVAAVYGSISDAVALLLPGD